MASQLFLPTPALQVSAPQNPTSDSISIPEEVPAVTASHTRPSKPTTRKGKIPRPVSCNYCRLNKKKCSHQQPCDLCRKKRLQCEYPDTSKRRYNVTERVTKSAQTRQQKVLEYQQKRAEQQEAVTADLASSNCHVDLTDPNCRVAYLHNPISPGWIPPDSTELSDDTLCGQANTLDNPIMIDDCNTGDISGETISQDPAINTPPPDQDQEWLKIFDVDLPFDPAQWLDPVTIPDGFPPSPTETLPTNASSPCLASDESGVHQNEVDEFGFPINCGCIAKPAEAAKALENVLPVNSGSIAVNDESNAESIPVDNFDMSFLGADFDVDFFPIDLST
ncbi:hypothetical protein EDC01DRAFT_627976 [Geopyxis carbonaria]|nr:hypothetical protein EDC01DRAFT_627976 [Geopyxis carbonaria]